ncbi:Ankyrin repeat-containing protein [Capsicum annuum]|nr:ankyrin repeat-containing protein At5g02620-like [Capsicum annuum]KAF3620311.1 Ankyrin repeat-containing protein [Capsicum annuum]KAF3682218.1 Ankyrin repeat-containing protein [Capsicum annuum]
MMDPPAAQPAAHRKKMTKQLTGKRDDSSLHAAARAGNLVAVREILDQTGEEDLAGLMIKQNAAGETALYVAAEYGYYQLVKDMIHYYDLVAAGIKARNGYDALHIAAKQGDLDMVKVLMEAHPELAMTVDISNTTALHTAANQGHIEVVNYLLEAESSLVTIAKSNGKTALHSAARNGHLQVLKALLSKESRIATRMDKKGQTALHMAVKGQNLEVVEELIRADPSLINMVDNKGNTALHIAARKSKDQVVKLLLAQNETDTRVINKSNETALDTAEKVSQTELVVILQEHGVQSARSIQPQATNPARELKKTVSDIKHGVHYQLETTALTKRRIQEIAKRVYKMHAQGLTNAISSTTVVAVLIATVAFGGVFQINGQWVDDPNDIPPGYTLGEANIGSNPAFMVFFIFDSLSLFIALAVVVVQTTIVVIETQAKRKMTSIINKLMWVACLFISIAYMSISYVVVGDHNLYMPVLVSCGGSIMMILTLGTLCYWIIKNKLRSSNKRSLRKNSLANRSRSRSWSASVISDSDPLNEYKKIYAI